MPIGFLPSKLSRAQARPCHLSEAPSVTDAILEEIIFGPRVPAGRGGGEPLSVSLVRELTENDLPDLLAPVQPVPAPRVNLQNITYAHHALAQQIVLGKSPSEVSLITGYSTNYIKGLQDDPLFRELLDYYGSQREQVFVDALERMKALGLATLDELQRRLAEEPEGFARRELMELAELMLIKGARPGAVAGAGATPPGASGGSPAVSVTVKFVQSKPPEILQSGGPLLDLVPNAEPVE